MPKFPKETKPETITIVGVERLYHGQRPLVSGESEYVEIVYAGVAGPSAILLYRRFLRELAATPGAVVLATEELARSIGVAGRSVLETIARLHDFALVHWTGSDLAVPALLPVIRPGVAGRLSASAQRCHARRLEALAVRS